VSRDGEPWIELAAVWPDGRSRSLSEVVILRSYEGGGTGLVLSDGLLHALAVEPPAELMARFETAGGFPVTPGERHAIFGLLAPAFAGVGTAIEAHTYRRACVPIVTVDLRDDDWMQVRLFAGPPDGAWRPGEPLVRDVAVFEWSPEGGWVPLGGDGTTPLGRSSDRRSRRWRPRHRRRRSGSTSPTRRTPSRRWRGSARSR
jgi:hypothetical protein